MALVVGLLLGLGSAALAILESSEMWTVLALGFTLAGAEIFLLTRAAGGFTSALLPVLSVNGVLLTSPLFWERVQDEAIVSQRRFQISNDLLVQGSVVAIIFSAAYTVGALVGGPRELSIFANSLKLSEGFKIPDVALIAVGYAGIVLAIYGYQGALIDGYYLESRGPDWAVIISTAGIPLSMLTLAIVSVRRGPWRAFAVAGLVIVGLICFGRASRVLALLPFLVLLATIFTTGKSSPRQTIAASIGTVLFLILPLAGRNNSSGTGLSPLLGQLLERPNEILDAFSLNGLLGNVMVSGPQTVAVAGRSISPHALWVSVNPLPGGLAGWHDVKDSLRFNIYTPYNTLGELAAHGVISLLFFSAFAGFSFAISARVASKLTLGLQVVASLLILGFAVRFSLSILQYNLRSSMRLIWWMILAVCFLSFLSIVASRKPAGGSTPRSFLGN